MIIRCIKTVVMFESKRQVFSENSVYETTVSEEGLSALNDQAEPHWLLPANTDTDDWGWFAEHFE